MFYFPRGPSTRKRRVRCTNREIRNTPPRGRRRGGGCACGSRRGAIFRRTGTPACAGRTTRRHEHSIGIGHNGTRPSHLSLDTAQSAHRHTSPRARLYGLGLGSREIREPDPRSELRTTGSAQTLSQVTCRAAGGTPHRVLHKKWGSQNSKIIGCLGTVAGDELAVRNYRARLFGVDHLEALV